jgi:DNA-binding CsgD family transcriptional regulator
MKRLSPRESEMLEMLVGGTRQQQAAGMLGISASTAAMYMTRARRKLGAKSRDQAIALFVTEKLKGEI